MTPQTVYVLNAVRPCPWQAGAKLNPIGNFVGIHQGRLEYLYIIQKNLV